MKLKTFTFILIALVFGLLPVLILAGQLDGMSP